MTTIMTTMIRASILMVLFVGFGSALNFPGTCYNTDNSTFTSAKVDEGIIFPVYVNESTAQRYVIDNTTQWKFNFGYLSASGSEANSTKNMYFDAVLESITNGTNIPLGAYESADIKIRASAELGRLTIEDFSFAGFVRNRNDFYATQPASYNISISYAEFRTKQGPESFQKWKYINKDFGSNCTTVTIGSASSNVLAQYRPFTMEMIFYSGLHLWFDIPLSLNYSARYFSGSTIDTFTNCPDCSSLNTTSYY